MVIRNAIQRGHSILSQFDYVIGGRLAIKLKRHPSRHPIKKPIYNRLITRWVLYFLVAEAGLEPTTFGL